MKYSFQMLFYLLFSCLARARSITNSIDAKDVVVIDFNHNHGIKTTIKKKEKIRIAKQ